MEHSGFEQIGELPGILVITAWKTGLFLIQVTDSLITSFRLLLLSLLEKLYGLVLKAEYLFMTAPVGPLLQWTMDLSVIIFYLS